MKIKTTAKQISSNYSTIISIGYCKAHLMLLERRPIAYGQDGYGWNFDVYDVSDIHPGTVICTGFRGMPKGVKIDHELLRIADESVANGNSEAVLTEWVSSTITGR